MNRQQINELNSIMNYTKQSLNSLDSTMNAIRNKQFIVGSFSSQTGFSTTNSPAIQTSRAAARLECNRLAKLTPGKLYIFLELSGAEMVPMTVSTISL